MPSVLDTVKALEHEGGRVTRFSATGFSLGGLIARYCITYAPNFSSRKYSQWL